MDRHLLEWREVALRWLIGAWVRTRETGIHQCACSCGCSVMDNVDDIECAVVSVQGPRRRSQVPITLIPYSPGFTCHVVHVGVLE